MSFGAPGGRGPRFIEPPEPPVATPLEVHRQMTHQLMSATKNRKLTDDEDGELGTDDTESTLETE